jgi:hypothetical protein
LDEIAAKVKEKIGKTSSTKIDDWKKTTKDIIDEHAKSNIEKEEKPTAFSQEKVKFGGKELTVKNIYSEIELADAKSTFTKTQLQDKYMINVDTAK